MRTIVAIKAMGEPGSGRSTVLAFIERCLVQVGAELVVNGQTGEHHMAVALPEGFAGLEEVRMADLNQRVKRARDAELEAIRNRDEAVKTHFVLNEQLAAIQNELRTVQSELDRSKGYIDRVQEGDELARAPAGMITHTEPAAPPLMPRRGAGGATETWFHREDQRLRTTDTYRRGGY